MTQGFPTPAALTPVSYAVLRYGGASPCSARAQLALDPLTAGRLERAFRARPCGGDDPMKPAFARHAAHVAAVTAQGGFPVLPERAR